MAWRMFWAHPCIGSGAKVKEEKSVGYLIIKALLLLIATGWLLLLALIMGTFATDSPTLTTGEAATAFVMVFGFVALPGLWLFCASCRVIGDVARWAHRDD